MQKNKMSRRTTLPFKAGCNKYLKSIFCAVSNISSVSQTKRLKFSAVVDKHHKNITQNRQKPHRYSVKNDVFYKSYLQIGEKMVKLYQNEQPGIIFKKRKERYL